MFFIPLVLLSTASPIFATFPDLPDVNSFVPNILEMIPINGQLRFNDQVFNFGGAPTTPTSTLDVEEEPRVDVVPPSNSLPLSPQTPPNFESRTPDLLPPLPTDALPSPPLLSLINEPIVPNNGMNGMRSQNPLPPLPLPSMPMNNEPIFMQNIGMNGMRSQNELPPLPQPIPQSLPMSENPINFQTRIPSLDSILSNMRSQDSAFNTGNTFNTLPNIGSTEVGSTFARNSNSDFRDEFDAKPSTPIPFGFPSTSAPMNEFRSNFGATESPLVVMPLVVSPDRLLQRDSMSSMSSTPFPIPALFSSTNDNEMRASERVESFQSSPVSKEVLFGRKSKNGSTDNSEVISRHTTLHLPAPIVTQFSNESSTETRESADAALDRTVRQILRNATTRADTAFKAMHFEPKESKHEKPLSLDQIELNERQRSQTTPKTESSEEKLKEN